MSKVTERLAALPQFYSYKDVLAVFDGDEDAFIDAFCDGTLPLATRTAIVETLNVQLLHVLLLRRVVRLLQTPPLGLAPAPPR
jgi:hypothetical protein